jgi:hypothetical protein
MAYEMTGKLVEKFDTVQRTETFKTREFVLEHTDNNNGRTFTNYIKFQCVQDRTSMIDRFNTGDLVKVNFNVRGTKWEKGDKVTYITNLDAWRIESAAAAKPDNDASYDYSDVPPAQDVDDLPF